MARRMKMRVVRIKYSQYAVQKIRRKNLEIIIQRRSSPAAEQEYRGMCG